MADSESILQLGIEAARAGDKVEARDLFRLVTREDPDNVQGWLWLAGVAEDREEKRAALERAVQVDPDNELARKGLQALGGARAATVPKEATPAPEEAQAVPTPLPVVVPPLGAEQDVPPPTTPPVQPVEAAAPVTSEPVVVPVTPEPAARTGAQADLDFADSLDSLDLYEQDNQAAGARTYAAADDATPVYAPPDFGDDDAFDLSDYQNRPRVTAADIEAMEREQTQGGTVVIEGEEPQRRGGLPGWLVPLIGVLAAVLIGLFLFNQCGNNGTGVATNPTRTIGGTRTPGTVAIGGASATAGTTETEGVNSVPTAIGSATTDVGSLLTAGPGDITAIVIDPAPVASAQAETGVAVSESPTTVNQLAEPAGTTIIVEPAAPTDAAPTGAAPTDAAPTDAAPTTGETPSTSEPTVPEVTGTTIIIDPAPATTETAPGETAPAGGEATTAPPAETPAPPPVDTPVPAETTPLPQEPTAPAVPPAAPDVASANPALINAQQRITAGAWNFVWDYGYGPLRTVGTGAYGGTGPSRGQWLALTIAAANTGGQPTPIPDGFFVLKDGQNRVYDFNRAASADWVQRFGRGVVSDTSADAPFGAVSQSVVLLFDVPPDATGLVLFSRDNTGQGYLVR